MKLHVSWGRVYAFWYMGTAIPCDYLRHPADEVSQQREVCRAFAKAPQIPIAETSSALPLGEKLKVGLPSSGDSIALHAMDMCLKYPLLVLVS